MTIDDIKEVVLFFKEQKIIAWNVNGFEGTFGPTAFQVDIAEVGDLKPDGYDSSDRDEDLYYSSEA